MGSEEFPPFSFLLIVCQTCACVSSKVQSNMDAGIQLKYSTKLKMLSASIQTAAER